MVAAPSGGLALNALHTLLRAGDDALRQRLAAGRQGRATHGGAIDAVVVVVVIHDREPGRGRRILRDAAIGQVAARRLVPVVPAASRRAVAAIAAVAGAV